MKPETFLEKSNPTLTKANGLSICRLLLRLIMMNRLSVSALLVFTTLSAFANTLLLGIATSLLTAFYGMIVGAKFYIDIQPPIEKENQLEK